MSLLIPIHFHLEHHEEQQPQYLDNTVYKAQHDRQLLQWLNCRPEGN